jgi:hypothetical protein
VNRIYTAENVERIGLSLEEIRDVLGVSEQSQAPCVHVLALLERKLEQWMPLSRDFGSDLEGKVYIGLIYRHQHPVRG